MASDTVGLAGYSVNSQTFALVTQASDQLLSQPYSGLMGLGWARLASSGAVPLWESLAESGQLATPVMTFYMARYRGEATATLIEYDGGLMTIGYINNTIYSGDINYVNFNSNSEDYWRIPVSGLRAGTTAVSIVSTLSA